MDLKQAKIFHEKINALHKNMSMNETGIPVIEKDLMLNYLRELYEIYSQAPVKTGVSEITRPVQETIRVIEPVQPPKAEPVEHQQVQPVNITFDEPKVKQEQIVRPAVVQFEEPVFISKPVELVQEEKPVVVAPPVVHSHRPAPKNEALEELFTIEKITELSEKLGESPIPNLVNAFSVNDRIQITNELFGGNKSHFDESLKRINEMASFDDAAHYLRDQIAERFGWASNEHKKLAKAFIKIVRRRFKQA